MIVRDLFEAHPDAEHFDALDRTGFFGAAGAGCVFLARDTGRLLIAHRSMHVEQPNTWGGWGGAINRGENPEEAVRREVAEEAGYHGHFEMKPLFVFAKGTFRYYNFLVIVDQEFTPVLDWETQGFEWCEWGHWPQPLHFGLVSLFGDPVSATKIQAEIARIQQDKPVDEAQEQTVPVPTFVKVKGDDWEATYKSTDGRFMIEKKRISSARNGHWRVQWVLIDNQTGHVGYEETFKSAKEWAHQYAIEDPTIVP